MPPGGAGCPRPAEAHGVRGGPWRSAPAWSRAQSARSRRGPPPGGARPASSEAHVDVVVVVREREGRAAEPEERDDLRGLHLGWEQEQRADGPLGDAPGLLVPVHRDAVEGADVESAAVEVRRDDAGPGELA